MGGETRTEFDASVALADDAGATPSPFATLDVRVIPYGSTQHDGGTVGTRPMVSVPAGNPPALLQVRDLIVGQGAVARPGATVEVHYVGAAWSTRQEFDSSWDRNQPFRFVLGRGQVITGWDQGVAGMRVGGRRQLIIPPMLAYGSRGVSGRIGPNETLVFVVDLLAVH